MHYWKSEDIGYTEIMNLMPISRNSRSQSRGLTLAELMIAIFVVSVGILGTISSLWYGIKSEKGSERRTNAVFLGRELANLVRSRNLPFADPTYLTIGSAINDGDYDNDADDNGARQPFNAAPFANDFPTNELNFERRIEIKLMSSSANNHLNDIVAIKVTLYWDEGGSRKEATTWAYHKRPS